MSTHVVDMPIRRTGIPRWERAVILLILLLAFALRVINLTEVPPGLHNDEVVSFQITERVLDGTYAVFFPGDTGHEAFYYYVVAPFMRVFGATVFSMRLATVFISILGLCIIWALSRRCFGQITALSALAAMTVTFWPLAFGRVVLRVVLMVPLAALSAYLFWRAQALSRRLRHLFCGMSGIFLGLAINTYTAARVLPMIYLAFGVYVIFADHSRWRRWWGDIALVLGLAALISLPLVLYLLQNPQIDQIDFFDVNRPLEALLQGDWKPVLETTLQTLGMFSFVGDPLPYYDLPGRPVFGPFTSVLLIAGLIISIKRWRQPAYIFGVLWFLFTLLPGMLSQPAPNYTRTAGVHVVLFTFLGIPISAVIRWSRRSLAVGCGYWRRLAIYVALALLFLGNGIWTAYDYFIVWPSVENVQFWYQSGLKAITDYLKSANPKVPTVICIPEHLIYEQHPWWKPARQHMRYLAPSHTATLRYYDCMTSVVLVDGPALYAFPGAVGGARLLEFPIYSQFLASANPKHRLLDDGMGTVIMTDSQGVQFDLQRTVDQRLQIARSVSDISWAPEVRTSDSSARLPVSFQDVMMLLGYHLSDLSFRPGADIFLDTYWRVVESLPPGLSQFTHVLRSDGSILTQQDGLTLTSESLHPGDLIIQRHQLHFPEDFRSGQLALSIGLYTPQTGVRLQILDGGQIRGDRLWLRTLEVQE